MEVLALGNSFSQDATRYLHLAAKNQGITINVANLVIGGCSLEMHYRNMLGNAKAYALAINGDGSGFNVSIEEALSAKKWDYISLQQASMISWDYSTYQPYLNELCAYIRKYQPHAKIVMHETWAYEEGSQRLSDLKFAHSDDMYEEIHNAYKKAAQDVSAFTVIPSGAVMLALSKSGLKMHLDTAHADQGVGRYALALTWLRTLAGADVTNNSFDFFDVPVSSADALLARKTVMSI